MLLVYWEESEVTKYKDLNDFLDFHGYERDYNDVHIATELSIANGEIKAVHYDTDEINEYIETRKTEKSDSEEHGTQWGQL